MIKFILYSLFFYFIFRMIFGGFKFRVYNMNQPFQQPNPPKNSGSNQGKITIDPGVKNSTSKEDSTIGEYVDFEEIK